MKNTAKWLGICLVVALWTGVAWADEATGRVVNTGFGSFVLEEDGTQRQFNLSGRRPVTIYDPAAWRPTLGDEVQVVYTPVTGRRGDVVLQVNRVTLATAGPNTVANVESPIEVEITEVGRSGIRGRMPDGKILRFAFGRSVQRVPAGWMPAVGEKARLTFRAEAGVGFTVALVLDKMEKIP